MTHVDPLELAELHTARKRIAELENEIERLTKKIKDLTCEVESLKEDLVVLRSKHYD